MPSWQVKIFSSCIQVYQRLKYARVVPWHKLNVDARTFSALGYDPNSELELRNLPTVFTDCLLHYKVI